MMKESFFEITIPTQVPSSSIQNIVTQVPSSSFSCLCFSSRFSRAVLSTCSSSSRCLSSRFLSCSFIFFCSSCTWPPCSSLSCSCCRHVWVYSSSFIIFTSHNVDTYQLYQFFFLSSRWHISSSKSWISSLSTWILLEIKIRLKRQSSEDRHY